MKSSKKISLCVMLLSFLLVVSSCGNQGEVADYQDDTENKTTITFFGNKYEPENVSVIEEIISDFMAENPDIRVSYESLKGNDYFDALYKRMAAGKGDDVFMVNHDAVLELSEKGQLADLSGLATISNYTEQMQSQMKEGEKIYWVPTTISAFGLYCNLDLLKEHDQKVPENLTEWEKTCDYFVEKGITPVIANNDISLKTLAIGESFYEYYQKDQQKEVFDKLNKGKENLGKYLHSGFSLVEEFISRGYIDGEKALNTEKTSDDLAEFVKGESPFMLTGAWAAGRVEGMKPEFKFQVAPYPVLKDQSLVVINADTRLSVNADSEHRDAAMKLVEFFSRAENIQKFADQQSSLSPLKGGKPSTVEEIQPLVSCYEKGRIVIGADGLLNLPIWELTREASVQLLSGKTAKEAIAFMDQQAEEGRKN